MKKLFVIGLFLSFHSALFAQRDTSRTVVVTSAFKPSLKTTSKINFSGALPQPDEERPVLQYDVPAQNLSFTYQSPALQPLAANIDSVIAWRNTNFVKVGYGNYTTPYLQAGLSFGDGVNSVVNVNGRYTSSKGPLPFQSFSKTNLEALGIFSTADNRNEWSGKIFFDNNTQYQYGFVPDTLKFEKDQLRRAFTTFGGKATFRNKEENVLGIDYNPQASLTLFADNSGGKENNFIVSAPITKNVAKIFAVNVGFTADVTSYKADTVSVDNNLYYFTTNLQFKTPNFKVVAGFNPSWDNGVFSMLPNFTAEAKINEEKFILQAGWTGYFNKTTYQKLASINPYLNQPSFLLNTRITEQYAGFKGSAGSHITYNARLSYLALKNQPLFVNDTITGRSFNVVNEPDMKDIRLHGEVGYTQQEKFSLLAGATFNQYSSLSANAEPWGLLPLEITGALRWNIMKQLVLKSDLFFWDGSKYTTKYLESGKLSPAVDLNAGLEFALKPNLNLWMQFNNVFNNKYERWKQYPVLGFNVLAGVVYSFDKLSQ